MFDSGVILLGEIRGWSLVEFKGLMAVNQWAHILRGLSKDIYRSLMHVNNNF